LATQPTRTNEQLSGNPYYRTVVVQHGKVLDGTGVKHCLQLHDPSDELFLQHARLADTNAFLHRLDRCAETADDHVVRLHNGAQLFQFSATSRAGCDLL
jgi:hypothetical protein